MGWFNYKTQTQVTTPPIGSEVVLNDWAIGVVIAHTINGVVVKDFDGTLEELSADKTMQLKPSDWFATNPKIEEARKVMNQAFPHLDPVRAYRMVESIKEFLK